MFTRSARAPRETAGIGALFFALIASNLTPSATARGTWEQTLQLLPDVDPDGGHFGCSVAVDQNEVLVGEWARDSRRGAAYLFDRRSGERLMMLFPEDRQPEGRFGYRVAMNDRFIIASQRGDMDRGAEAGAVYIFDRDTRLQRFKITPEDGGPRGFFGESIALDGIDLLVGATGGDGGGAVYLFNAETGQQMNRFVATEGTNARLFGQSVAFGDDGVAIVGALCDDPEEALIETGAAYVFDADNGTLIHRLTASNQGDRARFGSSVAGAPNRVLVGASWNNSIEYREGAVYIFDLSTGEQLMMLVPSDASPGMEFGFSMAAEGGRVVVGAHYDSRVQNQQGSAYIFDIATGAELARLRPGNSSYAGSQFGEAVALQGSNAVIGAIYDLANGRSRGTAYLFNSSTPTLEVAPSPLVAGESATFDLFNLAPDAATWVLYSTQGLDPRGVFIRELNVIVDLAEPAVAWGPERTTSDGAVRVEIEMPHVPQPIEVWFQGIQDAIVTNAVATEIVTP